ncbi:uncharacterized protein DKFZp434B061-like [Phoenix dactylifera]|uniref:Uncharacterized protein DKFZp434B061-like n=1 Tax=Phoenix dactylifera TaxID=42345 RepID=A0A8B8ZZ73_PHODC|nr:uncharacterized protein DKFZp434B061-like [Phoenix dactylifera]
MISHRHGSSSSETGQYPASVTLSPEAAADPNTNTVTSNGRRTSTAPFIPEASSTGFPPPETRPPPFSHRRGGVAATSRQPPRRGGESPGLTGLPSFRLRHRSCPRRRGPSSVAESLRLSLTGEAASRRQADNLLGEAAAGESPRSASGAGAAAAARGRADEWTTDDENGEDLEE